MTQSYLWPDSFTCATWLNREGVVHKTLYVSQVRVTWLNHMCNMAHSCVRHDSVIRAFALRLSRDAKMPARSMRAPVTRPSNWVWRWNAVRCCELQCVAVRSGAWRWVFATSPPIPTSHPSLQRHVGLRCSVLQCVAFVIGRHACRMRDMTQSYVWHDSFKCATWLNHEGVRHGHCTYLICDMTQSYAWHDSFDVRHDSFICVTWQTHTSCVWRDPSMFVTWCIQMCSRCAADVHMNVCDMMRTDVQHHWMKCKWNANEMQMKCKWNEMKCKWNEKQMKWNADKLIIMRAPVTRSSNRVCCWNVLQYAAVCCNASQCLTVSGRALQCIMVWYSALQCVVVCRSVLQCVAVCCSVLQCVAVQSGALASQAHVCYSVLQHVQVCCSLLQCVAVRCNALQCATVRCSAIRSARTPSRCVLQCLAARWSVLQFATMCRSALQCIVVRCSAVRSARAKSQCVLHCAGVHCSTLQYVAMRCNALQCVAVRFSALQCVAVWCSALQCVAV